MNERSSRSDSAPTVRWRRVLLYYLVVYAVSYGLVGGFIATGGSFQDPSWLLFAQASALVPALVAVGLSRWLWRVPLRASLGLRFRPLRWMVAAWCLGWVLALLALAFGLAMPGSHYDATLQPAVTRALLSEEQLALLSSWAAPLGLPPVSLLLPFGVAMSLTLSFVVNSGEEIGWRGFVHSELAPLGFWRNALLTGGLWVGWHLPLIAFGYGFPEHPRLGALLFIVSLLLASVGYAYVRERSGSVLAVALLQGTTEAASLLALAPVAGGSDRTVGVASVSWTAATVVVLIGLFAHDRLVAREPIMGRRGPPVPEWLTELRTRPRPDERPSSSEPAPPH